LVVERAAEQWSGNFGRHGGSFLLVHVVVGPRSLLASLLLDLFDVVE
jgi:hypothetical protein